MIVTTAGRTNEEMVRKAMQVAIELGVPFQERLAQSIESMQDLYQSDIFVVGKDRLSIYEKGLKEPLFFHPNSAMFRVKRLLRGEHDPFIDTSKLKPGMTLLDCTLGLASDSIVASVIVGEQGKVVGIEQSPYIAYLVRGGLQEWVSGVEAMDKGMRRIQVLTSDHFLYLRSLPTNSFDVVYFDPMFEISVETSDGLKGVKKFASYEPLINEIIVEAKRVAKQRVVLKDHWKSDRFQLFGFTVCKRPTSRFHFATIEME